MDNFEKSILDLNLGSLMLLFQNTVNSLTLR